MLSRQDRNFNSFHKKCLVAGKRVLFQRTDYISSQQPKYQLLRPANIVKTEVGTEKMRTLSPVDMLCITIRKRPKFRFGSEFGRFSSVNILQNFLAFNFLLT